MYVAERERAVDGDPMAIFGLPEYPKERSPSFLVTGKLMRIFDEAAILARR
jgi:hypothetical protein